MNQLQALPTRNSNNNKAWIAGITSDMAKIVVKHTMIGYNPIAVHADFSIKPLYTDLNKIKISGNPHKNGQSSYEKSFQFLVGKRHIDHGENIAFIPGDWERLEWNFPLNENANIGILTIKQNGDVYLHLPNDNGNIIENGQPLNSKWDNLTETSKSFITNAREAMKEIYPN
jgi:hypothetical protein